MRILLTGATGFLGRALIRGMLATEGNAVVAAVRTHGHEMPSTVKQPVVGDLSANNDWSAALADIDVVVHAAARVHVMDETAGDPLAEFRKVNVAGTLNLAKQAARAGVRRLVFISSIKVNGEATFGDPFRPDDDLHATEPYALSKWEAEQGLFQVARDMGTEVVVVRPPLIYGTGVTVNFKKLVEWGGKSVPLPFGSVNNKRSFVALDNMVDFTILCTHHPKAANEVFLISDGEDISTTTLLKKVAAAWGQPSRLVPVPVSLMSSVARVLGRKALADRLFGSLQVDSAKARSLLGWKPVITMDEQLRKTIEAYK